MVSRRTHRGHFTRPRWSAKVCVEGEGHSKEELRAMARKLIGRVTSRCYTVITALTETEHGGCDDEVAEGTKRSEFAFATSNQQGVRPGMRRDGQSK